MLDPQVCYRALGARDPRFDGLFFVGVETTGVYCRPICPARTPRRERCRFFASAAAAEKAGFRACLRCRPELAPGCSRADARPRLVTRALARIDAGDLDERSVEQLAAELGVSGRHLRRTLEAELGVGPTELAATRRLALAKQLLHDSELDLTSIAFASGFRSVRRFNAAFVARFGRPPSALRRELGRGRSGRPISLRLDLRPPIGWDALLEFLRERAIPGIEEVGEDYRRLAVIDEHVGVLRVAFEPKRPCLRVELAPALAPKLADIVARVRRLFDLDAQPDAIDAALGEDPLLAPLVARRPGLRVPGCFDRFEALLRTVLGQQVSLAAARTLTARLVERFGTAVAEADADAGSLVRRFPSPAALASAAVDELASIGIPRARASVLRTLARARAEAALALDHDDPETILERLAELPGVGPWTRDYAALRVLHLPDAFPAGDGALRRVFPDASTRHIEARAAAWRPFRAYAAQHLWTALAAGELS